MSRRRCTYMLLPFLIVMSGVQAMAHAEDAATPPPYVDRIIDPEKLAKISSEPEDEYDSNGLPRHFDVELLVNRTDHASESTTDKGLAASGYWETADYGQFSLDAMLYEAEAYQGEEDRSGFRAALWQRNVVIRNGWSGNNGLGVLDSSLPLLIKDQYRFFLPSASLLGASSEWINLRQGLQLQAAAGQSGVLNGRRMTGFDASGGQTVSAGVQAAFSPSWFGALTVLQVDGDEPLSGMPADDAPAIVAATAWQSGISRVQFNLLSSEQGLGLWVDSATRAGRYRHNYGLFHLEEALAWGGLPFSSDAAGAYYRLNYQHARWSWSAGIENIQSVSGQGFEGLYGSAFARYQASNTLGYGASMAVRDGQSDTAFTTGWFVDKHTRWGETRLQLDQANDGLGHDSWQVAVNQALPLRQGKRLSVAASVFSDGNDGELLTFSSYGGVDIFDDLALNGGMNWNQGSGPNAVRSVNTNVTLNWTLRAGWSVMASAYQVQGKQRVSFSLDPLLPPDSFVDIPEDRTVLLSLRYSRQAGRPVTVMGGGVGSAAGSIRGSVFLDENKSGTREASERAAAGVMVVLDGRYSVRTDALGEFEFPRVAIGMHTLETTSDNLPLPWFFAEGAEKHTVQTEVRETVRVDIGAVRER
jgi:hypothetical protein